ncbi:HAD family hydrolase [Roseateles asaccharophilus]|uniref:HAD superfamily hydrolase (TIGR01490 family) n=1 Tax=Roseateles asaccharophilus TaxID=582607 RepID=A0ABU2A582_9BURK|nr:HAD family hydrolase [Roseateles asaccharophilus]MDR7332357.1 HAD superfamily hydrolase (TIGR01490 family) [Roseateles asaccharophilus]
MNLTLFDLDGTLIPVDSDHSFGAFMVEVGWVDGAVWGARNDEFFAQYNAGTLNLAAYVDFATSAWRGRPLDEALAMRERFMAQIGRPALRPEAMALVEKHRAAGDLIALVTATNEFVTAPFAEAFGIEHLIAVQLERDAQGRYTGAIRGVPSFREGKIARVDDWLRGLGAQSRDFERVTFYSDSTNDLPLLERVSHPVATNPSPTLAQIATERGWPQLQLFA